MKPLALFVGIVLWSAGCAFGDLVVSRGDEMHIWLDGAVGPSFQVTFGYHSIDLPDWTLPSTTMGDDLWFDQPGTYDLSQDPQFAGFLSYATNGITDLVGLLFFDQQDLRLGFHLGESIWLGGFPDLGQSVITGCRINVKHITPASNGYRLTIQMEYLGVPEPASALLAGAAMSAVRSTRRRKVPLIGS